MGRKRNRNKGRRTSSPQLECTCSLRHEVDTDPFEDHAGICDLWHSDDFMNGLSEWDPIAGRLVSRWPDDSLGYEWADDAPDSDFAKIVDATVGGMSALPGGKAHRPGYISCRHNMTEVVLPDEAGTRIYCSGSMDSRGARPFRADWSIYLCHSWTARGSLALFIPWQDYGTPWVDWAQVRWAAQDAYARALAGQRVEIGCMGGHGRTGTLLACLAQLADPNLSARGSVDWVRANYCFKAVEDPSQRYFLEWFADPSLAPVWVEPTPATSDVTVIGPKGTGTECNWARNGVPCSLPLGHVEPHLYPAKAGGITLAEAMAQAKRI